LNLFQNFINRFLTNKKVQQLCGSIRDGLAATKRYSHENK
jgi:hypothetical protein